MTYFIETRDTIVIVCGSAYMSAAQLFVCNEINRQRNRRYDCTSLLGIDIHRIAKANHPHFGTQ